MFFSILYLSFFFFFFFFNDTATTEIYTLSLHDALPICVTMKPFGFFSAALRSERTVSANFWSMRRSEEHTSELQSQSNLVCRLLLEKKKKNRTKEIIVKSKSTAYIYMTCVRAL